MSGITILHYFPQTEFNCQFWYFLNQMLITNHKKQCIKQKEILMNKEKIYSDKLQKNKNLI